MSARELSRLVTVGRLVHLHHGWYALARLDPADAETPWDRRRRLHALQSRAVVAAHGGHAMASHHSALSCTASRPMTPTSVSCT